jgi:hypothetical protein
MKLSQDKFRAATNRRRRTLSVSIDLEAYEGPALITEAEGLSVFDGRTRKQEG